MFQGPFIPPPTTPNHPEQQAKDRAPRSFWHHFQATLVLAGALMVLLVVLSVIGRFVA